MAEQIKTLQSTIAKYQDGLEKGLITTEEYAELTSVLCYELEQIGETL